MIAHSWNDIPVEMAMPPLAETRTIEGGGMTIAFERLSAGIETAPLFKGLPGDACQSPHWGYVLTGRARVIGADGEELVLEAGQAYYLAPGHNVVIEEDCEFVEFSPAAARAETMEHAGRVLATQGA
jgi:hypothetical protein